MGSRSLVRPAIVFTIFLLLIPALIGCSEQQQEAPPSNSPLQL